MNSRTLALATAIVALISLPYWMPGVYYVNVSSQVLFYAVFAMGLNILVGYAGLVSLGHAGLFGIAAYATGYLLQIGFGHTAAILGALAGAHRVNDAVYVSDPSLSELVAVDPAGQLIAHICRCGVLASSTRRRSPPSGRSSRCAASDSSEANRRATRMSCSSVKPSVPEGRSGMTNHRECPDESQILISVSSGSSTPTSASTVRGSRAARARNTGSLYQYGGSPRTGQGKHEQSVQITRLCTPGELATA